MQNTSQFKTQCKGDISHALETNRCVLSHGMQNSRCALTKRAAVLNICSTWWYLATISDQPTLTSQLIASQSSVLTWMGILIQSLTHISCDLKVDVVHACPTSNMLLT